MIGFNHGLVGGIIAKMLPWPIAIPVALASHFVLDALPHYGIPPATRDTSRFWKYFFSLDFIATFGLASWAIINHHYAMFFAGLAAVSPDFIWVFHVLRRRSYNFTKTTNRFERWHIRIQQYEFPNGLGIELPLAIILFYLAVLKTR